MYRHGRLPGVHWLIAREHRTRDFRHDRAQRDAVDVHARIGPHHLDFGSLKRCDALLRHADH